LDLEEPDQFSDACRLRRCANQGLEETMRPLSYLTNWLKKSPKDFCGGVISRLGKQVSKLRPACSAGDIHNVANSERPECKKPIRQLWVGFAHYSDRHRAIPVLCEVMDIPHLVRMD
jgi:hypothetical protein